MMVASEADEAWWPPTFSPSVFSRIWLAWWMVQLASHSTLRSSSRRITRSSCEIISRIADANLRGLRYAGDPGFAGHLAAQLERDRTFVQRHIAHVHDGPSRDIAGEAHSVGESDGQRAFGQAARNRHQLAVHRVAAFAVKPLA